jgi:cell division protein FtsQ
MKRRSILDHQSVKRSRKRGCLPFKWSLGQLGFGLIKIFVFLLGLGGLSLACISGSQLVSSSPYFGIRNIVVTGIDDDLREEVVEVSGLNRGETLLSIDATAITRSIEAHPWIRSVVLKREFPHTLHIEAEHEEPEAIVVLDRMYLMDGEGVIFKEVQSSDSVDFPVVTGLSAGNGKNEVYLAAVAAFLDGFHSARASISVQELSEIHVEEDGAISIYFSELPFKVFLGKGEFIRKIDSLTHLLGHLRTTQRLPQVRSIDLSYRDRAVVAFNKRVV